MTTSDKPLPFSWIEEIFKTMFTNYGVSFLRKWSNGVMDSHNLDEGLQATKKMWALKLGCYLHDKGAIKNALLNLPEHPPSLPAFEALCKQFRTTEAYHALPNHLSETAIKNGKLQLESIKRMLETSAMLKGKHHVEAD
jgi:hypothetical protein